MAGGCCCLLYAAVLANRQGGWVARHAPKARFPHDLQTVGLNRLGLTGSVTNLPISETKETCQSSFAHSSFLILDIMEVGDLSE